MNQRSMVCFAAAILFFVPVWADECPASGTSRLGFSYRELVQRAGQASQTDDPLCVARGLALSDWLDREGRGACNAQTRIENTSEGFSDPDVLAFQAALAWRCGQPRSAHRAALAALDLDSSNTLAWNILARVLDARFRHGPALAAFRQALELDPGDPGTLMGLARLAPERPERQRMLERYLAVAGERGETLEKIRAGRESLAFVKELGDRKIWILDRADLPADLTVETLASRPGRLTGLVIRLQLGPEKKIPALLDSGASGLHLAPNLAPKAGLEALASATLVGGGGAGEHAVERGVIPLLDIGPVAFREALGVVAAMSLHGQGAYQAIFGVDILGGTRVTLQAGEGKMRVEEGRVSETPADPRQVDPWELGPGEVPLFAVEGQLLVPVSFQGIEGREEGLALIDTGASGSLIELETAEQLGGLRKGGMGDAKAYGGAMPLVGSVPRADVSCGRLHHPLHRLSVLDLRARRMVTGIRVSAFLGLDLLSTHTFTLDLASGTVTWDG